MAGLPQSGTPFPQVVSKVDIHKIDFFSALLQGHLKEWMSEKPLRAFGSNLWILLL